MTPALVANVTLFFQSKNRLGEFEATALRYLGDLYRTARFLARDSFECEDLVQETYLEAWKSFHRFQLGTNVRAWLFTILFRRIHHFRRRQVKALRVQPFDDPGGADDVMAAVPVPRDIQDEEILRALRALPLDFREVVVMADVQEFSYKEIADALDIPLGTVMSRLSRGRKLLRQELAETARAYGIGGGRETREGRSG